MISDQSPSRSPGSLSELLGLLDLGGRNWSYVEMGPTGGYGAPPSDHVCFHVCLHGSARLTGVSGGTMALNAGQAVFVLSGEAHALRSQADSAVTPIDFLREDRGVDVPPTIAVGGGKVAGRLLSARLSAQWPDGLHRGALPPFIVLDMRDQPLLRAEAFQLAGFGAGSTTLLTRMATLLLVATLRSDPQYLHILHSPGVDPIDQALRLIAANPSAPWTVERLARMVGMGRSNFAAHFTAKVGHAPMEVITDRRMEQALTLLRQGQLKIAEIAQITGYGSEAAFSRRFTRHYGTPPSQMRDPARQAALAPQETRSWPSLLPKGRLSEAVELWTEGSGAERPYVAFQPGRRAKRP